MLAELTFLLVVVALALPELIVRAVDAGKPLRLQPFAMLPRARIKVTTALCDAGRWPGETGA